MISTGIPSGRCGEIMAFKDLKDMSLNEYIKINKESSSRWLFMHIPKTAGSSFSEAMQELLPPYKNIEVDYLDKKNDHNVKLSNAVDEFIHTSGVAGYRSASGHVPFDLVKRITESLSDYKLVTFLRDPVKRVISDYRYQRTPQHPPYREFMEKFPSIESFITHEPAMNKLTKFICGLRGDASSERAIEIIENNFAFVGLVEMYPFSYNSMFQLFGHDDQFPTSHSRKTPDTPDTKIEIDEDVISLIKEHNRHDIILFEHVKKILIPVRDEWAKSAGHSRH